MRTFQLKVSIPLEVKQGEVGLFYGTSPLIRGLLVTGNSEPEVVMYAYGAIEDLVRASESEKAVP